MVSLLGSGVLFSGLAACSSSLWKYPREIFEWYLRRLLDAGFGDRLMFGSDVTPQRPEVIGESIEAIESISFLTQEQKRDIFYNNAVRFLRLEEE